VYAADLAHIHDTSFGGFADDIAPHLLRILKQAGLRDGRIVEVGCGSGRLARHLTDAGYAVRGSDVSPAMIRLARRHAPRGRFTVASLADVTVPRCDAVVSLGEVVTYVRGGLPVLSRFFVRVHDALEPGGLFVFDFMASATGRTFAPQVREGDGWSMAVSADYDRLSRTLTRRMAIVRRIGGHARRTRETHRVHIYSRREIRTALARAGFRDVAMMQALGNHRLLRGDIAVISRRSSVASR
jgi:SAM-dependent methyltransferase